MSEKKTDKEIFIGFLKDNKMYNPHASWMEMQFGHDIYFASIKSASSRIQELERVIKDARKFMDRLPSEWFSEITAHKLDCAIEEAKQ